MGGFLASLPAVSVGYFAARAAVALVLAPRTKRQLRHLDHCRTRTRPPGSRRGMSPVRADSGPGGGGTRPAAGERSPGPGCLVRSCGPMAVAGQSHVVARA